MSLTAVDILAPEVALIQDAKLREFAELCLAELPEHFEHMPASSSGKYHPSYALGDGGLIRHTKAAVLFAIDIIKSQPSCFTTCDTDIVICALVLHDGLKSGYEPGSTKFEHPLLMAEFCNHLYENNLECFEAASELISQVIACIACHMGRWNTSSKSTAVLPLPWTPLERLVHTCDYLASRKHYMVEIEEFSR